MNDVVHALADQHAELESILAGLSAADWTRPTPCEGWDVKDVVLHLAQTDALARASLAGRFDEVLDAWRVDESGVADVDDGAAAMVANERAASVAEVHARWREGADELRQAFEQCDPRARVQWVAGQLAVWTLATTRLAECWIHTGDVAGAVGVEQPPTDRLRHIARLAWRTLPYAFARAGRELHGPVAFRLYGPGGTDLLPDDEPATTITGPAVELCLVAARRLDPAGTTLRGEGPDAAGVLELVRTYA